MNYKLSNCKLCGRKIYFLKGNKNKLLAFNYNGDPHSCNKTVTVQTKSSNKKKRICTKKKVNKYAKKRNKIKERDFYQSKAWTKLKRKIYVIYESKCMSCGSVNDLQVDHIKPRSLHPLLELEIDNMQILCSACNKSKNNLHDTDYRTDDDIECLVDFKESLKTYKLKRLEEKGVYLERI